MKHLFIGIDQSTGHVDRTAVAYVRNGKIVDRAEVATCARCGKAVCDHSDIDFAGLAPLLRPGRPG